MDLTYSTTVSMAIFFGLYFIITGFVMLINKKFIIQAVQEMLASRAHRLLVGFMALFFGLFIVSFYRYYELHWPLIFTILGWLAVIKGIIYLSTESFVNKISKQLVNSQYINIVAILSIVLGIWLLILIFS